RVRGSCHASPPPLAGGGWGEGAGDDAQPPPPTPSRKGRGRSGVHHPPVFRVCMVFQVAAGGGGPASGVQCPDFFSASPPSLGMYVSSCFASPSDPRNVPSVCICPSVTPPCPSRNRSGRIPTYVTPTLAPPSVMRNFAAGRPASVDRCT